MHSLMHEIIKGPTCPPHSLVTSYFSRLAQQPIFLSLLHLAEATPVFLAFHPTKITSHGQPLKEVFTQARESGGG